MCRSCLFLVLCLCGTMCGMFYIIHYRILYQPYSSTYPRIAEFQTILVNNCLDFTDLPCSLLTDINAFFFWTKLLLIYYSFLIIAMIYTNYRTVRLLSCIFTLLVITGIIHGTDLVLYVDHIDHVSCILCGHLIMVIGLLSGYFQKHTAEDLLIQFCAYNVSSDDRYQFLENSISKRARFYRRVNKMKKQWNIKQDKLIITVIIGTITSIFSVIVSVYILPSRVPYM